MKGKKPRAYIVTRLAPLVEFEEEIYNEYMPYSWGKKVGVVCAYRTGGHTATVIVCSGDPVTAADVLDEAEEAPLTGVLVFTCLAQVLKDHALNHIKDINVLDVYGPADGEDLKQVLDRAEAELVKRGKEKGIGPKKPVFGLPLVSVVSRIEDTEQDGLPSDIPQD